MLRHNIFYFKEIYKTLLGIHFLNEKLWTHPRAEIAQDGPDLLWNTRPDQGQVGTD